VDPRAGQLTREGEVVRLDARTLRLLLCLAERPGEVISIETLLDRAWSGVIVTQDSVYQAITALRRVLGDDPKQPSYIATVPRLGYRMIATVEPWLEPAAQSLSPPDVRAAAATPAGNPPIATAFAWRTLLIALLLAAAAAWAIYASYFSSDPVAAGAPIESIGVVPFLDLTTQEMNEEYFADGMTEELIGDLSTIPGIRVPAPTSSFGLKEKALSVAAMAQQLGVAYLIDGSVRKSGNTYRVAMRLLRATDGAVVWTESYDRDLGDVLSVQKEIAAQAARALRDRISKAVDARPKS
jgi:TolB-like protein/DNA-binding winged helix-turn-helix (wHTH) protein